MARGICSFTLVGRLASRFSAWPLVGAHRPGQLLVGSVLAIKTNRHGLQGRYARIRRTQDPEMRDEQKLLAS